MKPDLAYAGAVTGNMESEEDIDFELDDSPEGRRHLISIMTDLYTDFELACIREYATNARDANIEAGNESVPIEVSLPNRLSPWYVVKDRGPGLDLHGLKTVFAKYGASTKRGSNDYNGSFGLGGKAALTYTSQFTIVGVKDGIKTNVIVNRRDDGVGVMKVISQEPTNEPSGVEIKIPVKDNNSFGTKCREFFYFWQPGTVLVDGAEPNLLANRDHVAKVGDNAYLLSNGSYGDRDVIVMGNVGYRLQGKELAESITSSYNSTVVYFVEMGAVSIAPSREGLGATAKTQAKLEAIKKELVDNIKGQIQSDLDAIKSYPEAFSVWTRWKQVMGSDRLPKMRYKNTEFISQIRHPHWNVGIGSGKYRPSTDDYGNTKNSRSQCDLSELLNDKVQVIVGAPQSGPTPNQMLKIEQYREDNGIDAETFMLFDSLPGAPWTNDVDTIGWADIDAIKVKRNYYNGGKRGTIPVLLYKSGGSYSYRNSYKDIGQWDTVTQLDAAEPILYLSPKNQSEYITKIQNVKAVFPKVQIVALGANRWEKFKRENPTAVEFHTYYHGGFERDMKASMTENEIYYADHDDEWRRLADWLGKGTDCPIVTKLAGIKVDANRIRVYNGIKSATKRLDTKYPLIARTYGEAKKSHAILYINAVVAEG